MLCYAVLCALWLSLSLDYCVTAFGEVGRCRFWRQNLDASWLKQQLNLGVIMRPSCRPYYAPCPSVHVSVRLSHTVSYVKNKKKKQKSELV